MSDSMQAVGDKIADILRRNDVKKASIFDSIVRGEMTEESDIDILVELEENKSLLGISHLKNELEDAIDRRVDILTFRSLHPRLRDWSEPLRVDNELSNFHPWRDVDEENEATLRPGIQDISSG
jgi:predicted nucleotidyltransferase